MTAFANPSSPNPFRVYWQPKREKYPSSAIDGSAFIDEGWSVFPILHYFDLITFEEQSKCEFLLNFFRVNHVRVSLGLDLHIIGSARRPRNKYAVFERVHSRDSCQSQHNDGRVEFETFDAIHLPGATKHAMGQRELAAALARNPIEHYEISRPEANKGHGPPVNMCQHQL